MNIIEERIPKVWKKSDTCGLTWVVVQNVPLCSDRRSEDEIHKVILTRIVVHYEKLKSVEKKRSRHVWVNPCRGERELRG